MGNKYKKRNVTERYYHLMLLPGMAFLFLFHIVPLGGVVIAFQNFKPVKGIFGSQFVGLDNFRRLFYLPDFWQILENTLLIAVGKIGMGMLMAVVFAVLLNECRSTVLKRLVQTSVYLPHFLSWVILAVMFSNLLSYGGVVNRFLGLFGMEPQMFLVSNKWFRSIAVLGDVWKEFGYNAVVYVAAMTSIDPGLYEAAKIDGANRWDRIWHITIPSILPTIILMMTLNMGQIMNAGFDEIFNLYSPLVYETGDIIDTYVYRVGLTNMQYSFGTAVGLFKSVISFILLAGSYKLADKFAGYRIF
jgi:putative aldouronate transport system permease protein